jgi:hypothetical protein
MSEAAISAGTLEARRYVSVALFSALLLLGAAGLLALGTLAMGRPPLPYQALFDFQAAKLEGPPADTIFVGDSTLGHAIDAGLWSELSGRRSVNLALTGYYGYEGGFNFIWRSRARLRPRNVILMYSPDMMTRPVAEEAFEATLAPADSTFAQLVERRVRRVLNFSELSDAARWLWRERTGRPAALHAIERDYMTQGRQGVQPRERLSVQQINPAKTKYLRLIGRLCERERLNCLYLHGPLASPTCERSKEYFDAVARLVASSNVRQVATSPLCLRPEALGDADDHVRPDLKSAATRHYYELVRRYLR